LIFCIFCCRSTTWAISFYERNGFRLVEEEAKKNDLLLTYWFSKELGELNGGASEKRTNQMATASVVLADEKWWKCQDQDAAGEGEVEGGK
jgi:hypothetical protein